MRDEAQAGLDEAAAELDAAESEARQFGEEATAARKRAAACDVEAKKATHTAARLKTEAANAARRVESLTEKHTWIPHEKGFFRLCGRRLRLRGAGGRCCQSESGFGQARAPRTS